MAGAEPKPTLVERLFADHRGALQTFFLRRIRAKADAADLAQEVYVRMLRISDQEAIRNPVHYLYTVANNLVKEHAALDRRQSRDIDIDEAPPHEQLETLPAFDGELDATQRVARLGVVLKQLRPTCRAAVELRFTQGLAFREIAMHLGVSPQMAKKYVAQGLSHCRRRMAALG
jgi:RNA polymerase sigma factor (sigma-70 family)